MDNSNNKLKQELTDLFDKYKNEDLKKIVDDYKDKNVGDILKIVYALYGEKATTDFNRTLNKKIAIHRRTKYKKINKMKPEPTKEDFDLAEKNAVELLEML